MIPIPPGVSSPALIRDPITVTADGKALKNMTRYRIIDLSVAEALCKNLVARASGTAYQRLIDGNGKKSRRKLPVFELKRDSETVSSMNRTPATMRPSKPPRGAIIRSGYAKRLDGFVHRHPASVEMFEAWRGANALKGKTADGKPCWKGAMVTKGVAQELELMSHRGSILYLPGAGQITSKSKENGHPAGKQASRVREPKTGKTRQLTAENTSTEALFEKIFDKSVEGFEETVNWKSVPWEHARKVMAEFLESEAKQGARR